MLYQDVDLSTDEPTEEEKARIEHVKVLILIAVALGLLEVSCTTFLYLWSQASWPDA